MVRLVLAWLAAAVATRPQFFVIEVKEGRWFRALPSGARCDGHFHRDPDDAAGCQELVLWLGDFAWFVDGSGNFVKRERPRGR